MIDRPRIPDLKDGPTDRLLTTVAIAALLATIGAVARHWPNLPALIPSKLVSRELAPRGVLWALPGLSLLQFTVLGWLRQVPHLHNFPVRITPDNARRQYQMSRTLLAQVRAFLACLLFWNTAQSLRLAVGLPRFSVPSDLEVVVALGTLSLILALHFRRAVRD